MKPCTSCERPLLPGVNACPFCGIKLSSKWMALAGAVVTPFVLSACYGGPPCVYEDNDSDGYGNCTGGWDDFIDDCNDDDPNVNPEAEEVCDDGIDNNCDGIEGSEDGVEVCGNELDDDCDGEIDELATEPGVEADCVNGLDDDCDGLIDSEDPDCGAEEPDGIGSISVGYTFSADDTVETCEAAGLTAITLALTGPEDVPSVDVACNDGAIAVPSLAAGEWTLTLSGEASDGLRTWASEPQSVTVAADQTTAVDAVLVCSSEADDGCGGG